MHWATIGSKSMAEANQMKTIGDLLTRDLSRKIEEIIQVDQADEQSVYAEITEYVATDSIRDQYHHLLKAIAEAPADPHESVGVWVSGFFGSGKSSFAKNLGYALENRTVLGSKFADLFKQQLTDPKKNDTRISDLLDLINARTPTGVILFEVAKGRNTRFPKAQRKNMTAADMLLWGKDTLRSISSDAIWNKPLEWNRKAERTGVRNKVFCGS